MLIFYSIKANSIGVGDFFLFGTAAGDVVIHLPDISSSDPIPLSPPFPVLGERRTSLRVGYKSYLQVSLFLDAYIVHTAVATVYP